MLQAGSPGRDTATSYQGGTTWSNWVTGSGIIVSTKLYFKEESGKKVRRKEMTARSKVRGVINNENVVYVKEAVSDRQKKKKIEADKMGAIENREQKHSWKETSSYFAFDTS